MRTRDLYIDEPSALEDFLVQLDEAPLIGIDTEFVREKTYFPLLCLVQIATPGTTACIDCLAELDLQALLERLVDGDAEWIVHSSRQDLEVIYQHTARLPTRLIDTQIAAGLVGFAPQIGLQDVLAEVLDVSLPKEFTRTDWSRRPLPEPVLEYARDDVRSLHALWSALGEKLDALGRREWVEQDCVLLTRHAPLQPAEQIWSKLRGVRGLGTEGAAAALALVKWREARARARNRPRRWILSDEHLVAIAKRYPLSTDALRRVPDLPGRMVERLGREIVAAIRAADSGTCIERASALVNEEPPERRRVRALQEAAKDVADSLGVHAEVFATKQELVELLKGREPPRFSATWRAQYLTELGRLL